jgi:hypothetical protein
MVYIWRATRPHLSSLCAGGFVRLCNFGRNAESETHAFSRQGRLYARSPSRVGSSWLAAAGAACFLDLPEDRIHVERCRLLTRRELRERFDLPGSELCISGVESSPARSNVSRRRLGSKLRLEARRPYRREAAHVMTIQQLPYSHYIVLDDIGAGRSGATTVGRDFAADLLQVQQTESGESHMRRCLVAEMHQSDRSSPAARSTPPTNRCQP